MQTKAYILLMIPRALEGAQIVPFEVNTGIHTWVQDGQSLSISPHNSNKRTLCDTWYINPPPAVTYARAALQTQNLLPVCQHGFSHSKVPASDPHEAGLLTSPTASSPALHYHTAILGFHPMPADTKCSVFAYLFNCEHNG